MKRVVSVILLVVLVVNLLPLSALATGDALPKDEIRTLLNNVTLYPQVTGYPELDAVLEQILSPNRSKDVYTQIKAAYDWTIHNIDFSWKPYSQNWAPAYDCFAVDHHLRYDDSMQEVIPYEVANRTYHVLTKHEGVCYDYSAAFAVMARYIGIDSYVHTGMFTFEAGYGNGAGHHGWVELDLNGTYYIFDSQRDYRLSANGTSTIRDYYFGIPMDKAWRYQPETNINTERDAQFLSVQADRIHWAEVTAKTSASCSVSGLGRHAIGSTVTLTAASEKPFVGWFDNSGNLLCDTADYSFVLQGPTCLYAICEGEYFTDITPADWYFDKANEAYTLGLVDGTSAFTFSGSVQLNRAMAITILARYAGDDSLYPYAGFVDVEPGSWYESAINWGAYNGVINGYGDGSVRPLTFVSREQFITMLVRYAGCEDVEGTELTYSDADCISDYAREALQVAQTIGLIEGYEGGSIRPLDTLTRAEGVTILLRLIQYLESNA